jgi:hypothetical protein
MRVSRYLRALVFVTPLTAAVGLIGFSRGMAETPGHDDAPARAENDKDEAESETHEEQASTRQDVQDQGLPKTEGSVREMKALAEARIAEEDPFDPIKVGDRICPAEGNGKNESRLGPAPAATDPFNG